MPRNPLARMLRFKLNKSEETIDRVLRFVVRQAAENISGYARLLSCLNLDPRTIHTQQDLARLPIIDKADFLRAQPLHDILHCRATEAACVRSGTSGSSGVPLQVFLSPLEAAFRRLLVFRAWRQMASLRLPLTIVDLGTWPQGQSRSKAEFKHGMRIVRMPVALPIEQQVETLIQYRPRLLTGFPTALSVLATALPGSADLSFLRLVATRGEILHPDARRLLNQTFGCRVADFYSAEETGNIAAECPGDSSVYHVNTDGCIVEIVDDEGNPMPIGEPGRVVATSLFNCTMPFIRYDLHDRAALLTRGGTRCDCGSTAPSLSVCSGRDDDYGYLPNGTRISPRVLATTVSRAFVTASPLGAFGRNYRRFQVIQDAVNHVTVRIEPDSTQAFDYQAIIERSFASLHPELSCSVEIVDELAWEPSGKFKKVICRIPAPDGWVPPQPDEPLIPTF